MSKTQETSEDAGFLSRWSRRKQAAQQGEALPEPEIAKKPLAEPQKAVFLDTNHSKTPVDIAGTAPEKIASENPSETLQETPQETPQTPPPPTLEDAKALNPESDFKPFMRADVQPEVKNAALKQLFKDPHFNTMDMMDVYVDDYSKPDPLPPEMLRKMAVTKFLGFWDEEEEEEEERKKAELASLQKDELLPQVPPNELTDSALKNEPIEVIPSPALGDDASQQQVTSVAQSEQ